MNDKLHLADKDHPHFTNDCFCCKKTKDDKSMIAVWVTRISGIYPKAYFEPDYMCKDCLIKINEEKGNNA